METRRLILDPLRAEHADEAAPLLGDVRLHEFIGGEPLTLVQLRRRYAQLASGPGSLGLGGRLNWTVRLRATHGMVGTAQATLRTSGDAVEACLAWVTVALHQRRGYATEAAAAIIDWLGEQGVRDFVAYVHPDHVASIAVAERIGMTLTAETHDGENLWARRARAPPIAGPPPG